MAKPNHRSLRYSNEVRDIVLNCPGKGFNQKFENLVLDYIKSIDDRKKLIKSLDKDIADKKQVLYSLTKKIDSVKNLTNDIDNLNESIIKVVNRLNQIESF